MGVLFAGQYLVERLREFGVEHLFGVPGDFSLAFLDSVEESGTVSWVGAASELGAAYAADGYARVRGLGVVVTAFGVGELSAAAAVAGAMAEDVAVLHVVVGPPSAAVRSGAAIHHTFADGRFDRFRLAAEQVTAAQYVVGEADPAGDIDDALQALVDLRRPVYLLLPQDVAELPVAPDRRPLDLHVLTRSTSTVPAVTGLVEEFFDAYPEAVVVLGHLLLRRGLTGQAALLAVCGVRTAVLPNVHGLVDGPAHLGTYNGKLSPAAVRDGVESDEGRVLVGCTLADTTTGGLSHRFAPESTLTVGRESVSWGQRSIEVRFEAAVETLVAVRCSQPGPVDPQRARRPVDGTVVDGMVDGATATAALTQALLWSRLESWLPSDVTLFADTGSAHYGALDHRLPPGTRYESAAIWAAIGYAYPAAVGAALADPARRVVTVVGDGALQVVAAELGLAARYGARTVTIVLDNRGYTVERVIRGEAARYNDIAAWDWAAVATAMGAGRVHDVRTVAELDDALAAAADAGAAHVVVCHLSPLDVTPTLAAMSDALRAKAHLPLLALREERVGA